MPLSKKRMRERKRLDRKSNLNTMPIVAYDSDGAVFRTEVTSLFVKPNDDALQSISRGIKGERDSTVPPVIVQPKIDKLIGCKNDIMWLEGMMLLGGVVQPIQNCPDGRYRR